ncbi:MAG: ATP-binding protein [Pseudomonadota bacterium]
MGIGALLLAAGTVGRLYAGDDDNLVTRVSAVAGLALFALFAPLSSYVRAHHHAFGALAMLPLLIHTASMSYGSSLAQESAIINLTIFLVMCIIIDSNVWLRTQTAMWNLSYVGTAVAVTEPVTSPVTYVMVTCTISTFGAIIAANMHYAQAQLRNKIAELDESQGFARVGSWEWDAATQMPTWSKTAYDIFEYDPGEALPDRDTLFAQTEENAPFINAIDDFFTGGDRFDAIGQMTTRSGKTLWVHSKGMTLYEKGEPARKFGVFSDITEHVAREKALEVAREQAEAAAEARTQFLANMSHEIRTPMNGVIGMTSLLEQEKLPPEAKRFVDIIRGCGESLMATINDILDFTKLDAGKVVLESRVFNVGELLKKSTSVVQKTIDDKGLNLTISGNALDVDLQGDPLRLQQVLVNLLSNAAKFTETGGITIHADVTQATQNSRSLTLAVSDTGIGIPNEALEHLFSPFTQADASTTRQYGGTGLGLTISHQLVTQMQGSMEVTSEVNQGTRFTISLTLPYTGSRAADQTEQAIETSDVAQNLSILLAEDNPVNQTVALRMLKRLGIEPVVVDNGVEAVKEAQARPFDLVLMDLQMPQMDGLEATTKIRELTDISQPRIIALTANAMAEDRSRCIDAGMDDFLAKPVRMEDLRAAIAANT